MQYSPSVENEPPDGVIFRVCGQTCGLKETVDICKSEIVTEMDMFQPLSELWQEVNDKVNEWSKLPVVHSRK